MSVIGFALHALLMTKGGPAVKNAEAVGEINIPIAFFQEH